MIPKLFIISSCFALTILAYIESDTKILASANTKCRYSNAGIIYPDARRDDGVVDEFNGIKIADPYRWLENPDSNETKQFIAAQNELSKSFLSDCDVWPKINEQMKKLVDRRKYSVPQLHGEYYIWWMNTGHQNQDVLYKQKTLDDEPTVLLDLNEQSPDGSLSLNEYEFSSDEKLMAYGVSRSGSDWVEVKIRNVESGQDYPETLMFIKYSDYSWTQDGKGFFYSRYPMSGFTNKVAHDSNIKLYYHRVGESQDMDILIAEYPENPDLHVSTTVSGCGNYLILYLSLFDDDTRLYYADLEGIDELNGKLDMEPIITVFNSTFEYIRNTGKKFVFMTNRNAPNYHIVEIDLERPMEENWRILVPEHPSDVLLQANPLEDGKILADYSHDVKHVLKLIDLESGNLIRRFSFGIEDITEMYGYETEFFIRIESFLTPGTIYQIDLTDPTANFTVFREETLNLDGFDKSNFDVKQVFYPSRDGTNIPMFIVQKRGMSNAVPKPTILYAYGGFAIDSFPSFDAAWLYFIKSFDGILAIANIRGGKEYGGKWHEAGRLLNKQNSYDDFQAAAEYLIQNNYTEAEKIGIQGVSNGGLMIGVCINQRPDLFGAAVAEVGLMDMLRYQKFTVGSAWISEFGNPDEQVYFENIRKYSPLQNVHTPNSTQSQYPATILLTGDHDDTVSPLHTLKFAATLQHAAHGNAFQKNPIVMKVYSDIGHGGGKSTAKMIETGTDFLTFLYRALRIEAEI